MRKNARANRERILAAAEAVFGASGELGSTEDVAGRAGVGIATVFRHFPTKDALIEATLIRQFERLDVQEATRGVQAAIGGVLARAQDAGVVAGDVTVEEFFVLVRGVGQAAATMPAAPVTLDRAIEIICRGLAPAR